ncbi:MULTISPECIES: restriction endonuclease subunit S [Lactiplantibacillus]|uniref:restriction endonuclease subunit S n=1 Tax=Lactiplantibacillus TaxID=2767842 RepID=UPI00124B7E6D|nr:MULTISPECIES: restriction endonuclease subunit S [Lactiplantibacillus]KAB1952743.1 restriction endonuclease subunit S [Lactiplantibacillus plantarum]UZM84263.1 restriction endonuclease subunit S [Lactiplantibacillus argentoratensis]
MKDNQAKYPQLRFKGFTDPWEKRSLDEITTKTKSYSLSRDVERDHETGYRYIHYGDIHTGVADIVTEHTNLPNIEPANYDELRVNDLVVADASEDYQGIAEPAVVVGLPTQHLVAGLHTIALRPSSASSLYLYYLLHTESFKHFGYQTGTGLKVFGISWSNLSKFTFMIPSRPEQEKIVKLIESVDNLTSDNQRKLAKLKELKQGYLQKLFPKNGSKFPQLRFAGFADDWEERKLGDITKISTGKLDANAMVENGKYDFYTSGIKKYRIDVAAFEGPSITIAGNGATVGYMHLADNKFNAYQRTYVLQEFLVDRSFIFSEIGNKLPKKIKQEARTGNIPYIVMDMLTELKVSIPQNDTEQKKIGDFFKQLDDTIALHQRKLEKLQELKKGYLQKMFC